MLNNRDEAALRVQADLLAYENALDQALILGGRLATSLPTARIQANFACEVGQDAIDHTMSSLTTIAAARRHAVDAHRSLNKTRLRFNLPIVATGDKEQVPPPKAVHASQEAADGQGASVVAFGR